MAINENGMRISHTKHNQTQEAETSAKSSPIKKKGHNQILFTLSCGNAIACISFLLISWIGYGEKITITK